MKIFWTKNLMFKIKKHFWLVLVFLYFLGVSSVYAVMSLVKHSHYQTLGDLGVFNQGVWLYSQFKWPILSFHINGPFLGDHFHPILVTLAPFYWLWPGEETLLGLQPFIILSAIIPLYLISLRLTKSIFFTLSIILAYSFYIPLQYTIFYDFHEIVFLPPLFAWAYYFFINKKKLWTAVFLFLCLLVKEEVGFFVATFGLYLLLFKKNWRLFGLGWLVIGVSWSLAMVYWIIPQIAGAPYRYLVNGDLGNTPGQIINYLIKDPAAFIKIMIDNETKRNTLYRSFYPFAFLPLGSLLAILMSLQQFFIRFLSQEYPTRFTLAYHYSAPLTIIMPLGAIEAAVLLKKIFKNKIIFIILGILIIIFTRLDQINRSALLLVKRPIFWARDPYMDSVDKALKFIPPQVSVAAQNSLLPHVSTREQVWTIRDLDKAQYLFFDFHPGQSSFNFLGQEYWDFLEKEVREGTVSGKYKVVFSEGDVWVLENNDYRK